jgi:hypothetical protein
LNVDFGEWYRAANIEPTNEMLTNRWQGVEAIREKVDKDTGTNLVRLFLMPSEAPDEFIRQFRQTFFDIDNSFRMKKNEKELQVLAGASIIAILEDKSALRDGIALTLVASAAPNIRKTVLLPDVIESALSFLFERSAAVRKVEKASVVTPGNFSQVIEQVKNAAATNSANQLGAPLEQVLKSLAEAVSNLHQNSAEQVNALQRRLDVVAEETEMVWWLFGSVSRQTEEAFKGMPPARASLLAAVDLAELTKIIPPPRAAVAYLDRALGEHGSLKCGLETLASQVDFPEDLPGEGLFPITTLLNSVRNGKPSKETAESVARVFNLKTTPHVVSRLSRQFYNELIAAQSL